VNEHDQQKVLTARFVREGAVVGGRRCFLVAWELMFPSWTINWFRGKWNEPSIDFVFADETGGLYSYEFKPVVAGPGNSWRALAQATHRAVLIHDTRTFEKLREAFVLSRTHIARFGEESSREGVDLLEQHRDFFGLEKPLAPAAFLTGRVGRVVAASHFKSAWPTVLAHYASSSETEVIQHLSSAYKLASGGNCELRRLVGVGAWRHLVTPKVASVEVSVGLADSIPRGSLAV